MAITLDSVTQQEYLAQTAAASRATLIRDALTAPVLVRVYRSQQGGPQLMGSGTMADPWCSVSGATVTIGEVNSSGFAVSEAGIPDGSWYLQFEGANGRTVRGGFGLSGSGADFTWSLASFAAGGKGTIGTAVLTTTGLASIVTVPSISSTSQVGVPITGDNGTWVGGPTSYVYQHQRSANGTSGWADIPGANASSYTPVAGDAGFFPRRGVAAVNPSGTSPFAYSAAGGQIAAAGSQPLLTGADITYLGYFDLALGIGDPFYGLNMTHRYVGGQSRLIMSIFPGNGASTRTIAEIAVPGTLGGSVTTTTNTWTVPTTFSQTGDPWAYGATGQGYAYGAVEQLLWDETNGVLLRTALNGYPDGFTNAWLDVINLGAGGPSVTKVKRVLIGTLDEGRLNGGHCFIPAAFQSEYGVGPLALGTGGYRSLVAQYGGGAPMGFTTYAVANPASASNGATLTPKTLAAHYETALGRRAYLGYTFTQTGTKTFTSQEVTAAGGISSYNGVTVPSGTFTGQGPISYISSDTLLTERTNKGDPRGNPANASAPTFEPVNTAQKGVTWGEVAPGETTFQWLDWYAGKAFLYGPGFTKRGVIAVGLFGLGRIWYSASQVGVERAHMQMHIFDPVHLGEVALGTRAETNVQPVSYRSMDGECPITNGNSVGVPSVAWDATAKRLYVFYPTFSGGVTARVHVYQVNA